MSKGISIDELLSALTDTLSPQDIITAAAQSKIAFQIAKYRTDRGMSQKDFADFMGVTQSTISKWENGDYNFSIEKLAQIACKLDVELQISLGTASSARASATDNVLSDQTIVIAYDSRQFATLSPSFRLNRSAIV